MPGIRKSTPPNLWTPPLGGFAQHKALLRLEQGNIHKEAPPSLHVTRTDMAWVPGRVEERPCDGRSFRNFLTLHLYLRAAFSYFCTNMYLCTRSLKHGSGTLVVICASTYRHTKCKYRKEIHTHIQIRMCVYLYLLCLHTHLYISMCIPIYIIHMCMIYIHKKYNIYIYTYMYIHIYIICIISGYRNRLPPRLSAFGGSFSRRARPRRDGRRRGSSDPTQKLQKDPKSRSPDSGV